MFLILRTYLILSYDVIIRRAFTSWKLALERVHRKVAQQLRAVAPRGRSQLTLLAFFEPSTCCANPTYYSNPTLP